MSIEYLITDYEKLEYFVNLLKSRASGQDVSELEYMELREELLANKVLQSVLPSFVKTNGELNSFWRFIKGKFSTYNERTEFLTKEFEPILQMLQNSQTTLPTVQKYAHTQDSIKQEIKEYFKTNKTLQNIYGEFTLADKNIGNGGTSEVKGFEFAGKLPDEINWRKDKMGWPIPEKKWFYGNLNRWFIKNIESCKLSKKLSFKEKENKKFSNNIKRMNLSIWEKSFLN